ncbi:3-oxoacyl-[acyl-carrier-protein] synthase III C-terminal domain-containing protein [Kitasatospora fiedleri]|uniref:3-oxoacyl-[acyl-carrier-protein] synthase III C-terminal domain-containing protein n=1 Tax=Kitasatospora fiedleri TaxID=2991545 RepID=UPI00249B616B|nr:3-oxoacyl-[acyl-carrier-protein] synthase III C-terminal domain-containing protein [Kitasatospora fiedleri]
MFAETVDRSLRRAVTGALEQAGLGPNASLPVALPRLGRSVLESAYLPALAGLVEGEVLDFGPDTGHLGAGDAAASLAEADARGLVPPGGHLLVISAGAGFTWTALVVQAL